MTGAAGWAERARSFGRVAERYTALRPGYPAEVVAFAVTGTDADERPRRVVDVGAGTGLLSEGLLAAGHDVVAVEPASAMRAKLAERLPGATALDGTAERLPLPDGSVDVVCAAQAAHWFDPARAALEFRRVLRPGGAVCFIWNMRDEAQPWSVELDSLLAAEGVERFTERAVVEAFAAELSAAWSTHSALVRQPTTPEAFVDGLATRSYVATMDAARRADFLDRVRRLLDRHPEVRGPGGIEVRHRCTAWRLLPGAGA